MLGRNNLFLYLAAIFIALSLAILPTQTAFANEESDKHNMQGVKYFNEGTYDVAITHFTNAILKEKQALYYYNRGNSYFELSKYENAIKDYTEAINRDVNNPEYYDNRGRAYYESGKSKEALNDFNKAIDLSKTNPNPVRGVARVYRDQGNNEEAKKYFLESAKKRYDSKSYEDALIDFNDAIKLDDKDAELYDLRGWTYYHLEKYDEALEDFGKAIDCDSNYAHAYEGRAYVYHNQGKKDSAKIDFKTAGVEYIDVDNTKAREVLNKAIEIDNNYGEAYYYLGQVENRQSTWPEAIKQYEKAINLGFDEDFVYTCLGYAKYNLHEYDDAIKYYKKALGRDSNHAEAYKSLAELYHEQNEPEKASDNAKKYLELNGQNLDEDTKKYYEDMIIPDKPSVLDSIVKYFTEANDLLIALFIVIAFDYATTIGCNIKNGTLTVGVATREFAARVIIPLLIIYVISAMENNLSKLKSLEIKYWAIILVLIYQLFSIIESAERLGLPVPDWLKNLVRSIKEWLENIWTRLRGGSGSGH